MRSSCFHDRRFFMVWSFLRQIIHAREWHGSVEQGKARCHEEKHGRALRDWREKTGGNVTYGSNSGGNFSSVITFLVICLGMAAVLLEEQVDWVQQAKEVLQKHAWRYQASEDVGKQIRFLMSRGFTSDVIREAIRESEGHENR